MRIISSVHIKVEHSILRAPKSTSRSQGARMVQLASARPSLHEIPRLIRGDITSLFWVQLLSFLCSFDQLLIPLKRSIDGGGWKWAHHRAQIYQLLLSRVIDVKYGCFTFFMHNMGASMSKQWECVKFATWRSCKRMFLRIIWFSIWWMKSNYLYWGIKIII